MKKPGQPQRNEVHRCAENSRDTPVKGAGDHFFI